MGIGLKPPIGTRVIDSTPGADEGLAGIELDRAGRHVDRLHRGAAEAVDGGARRARDRQMREQRDQARDVHALLALGEGAADDHVLDVLGSTPVRAISAATTCAARSSGRTLVERALVREMERRAGEAGDHDVFCIEHPLGGAGRPRAAAVTMCRYG